MFASIWKDKCVIMLQQIAIVHIRAQHGIYMISDKCGKQSRMWNIYQHGTEKQNT